MISTLRTDTSVKSVNKHRVNSALVRMSIHLPLACCKPPVCPIETPLSRQCSALTNPFPIDLLDRVFPHYHTRLSHTHNSSPSSNTHSLETAYGFQAAVLFVPNMPAFKIPILPILHVLLYGIAISTPSLTS